MLAAFLDQATPQGWLTMKLLSITLDIGDTGQTASKTPDISNPQLSNIPAYRVADPARAILVRDDNLIERARGSGAVASRGIRWQ